MAVNESPRTKQFRTIASTVTGFENESSAVVINAFFHSFGQEGHSIDFTFAPLSKQESAFIVFDIADILQLTITDAFQINWTEFVEIDFSLRDFNAPVSIDLVSFEYSIDGGTNWNTGTLDFTHANSNTTFPFTSSNISNHSIVWNAIGDLGEGRWGIVKLRLTLTDTTRTVSAVFDLKFVQKFFGMGYFPPTPLNFKKDNVDDDPIPLVDLSWTAITNNDLHQNILKTNDWFARTTSLRYLMQHERSLAGYRLYRDLNASFQPPSQGVLVDDETTLTASVSSVRDNSVSQGTEYFYKIGTVINE